MVTLRVVALVLVLGSTGCSEPLEPSEFAEQCGVAGPVRVLELAPDQAMTLAPTVLGERVYYNIARPEPGAKSPNSKVLKDPTLWSTGPCGESPTRVADGVVQAPFTVERWPDLVFACHEERGDILLLDPDGAAPKVVFADVGCGLAWTDEGLLGISRAGKAEGTGALHFHPYPDDPREGSAGPEVLIDTLSVPLNPYVAATLTEDAIFTATPAGELLRVDLADRSITVEQTDVRDFDVSADGRYLLWRGLAVVGGEPEYPLTVVTLTDRVAGSSVSLGHSYNPVKPFGLRWADKGLLVFLSATGTQIYFLSDLSFIEPIGAIDLTGGPLDDDRWLMPNPFGDWLQIIDLTNGRSTSLFRKQGQIVERGADGVYIVDSPICCIQSDGRGEGALWYVPYDGSEPRRVSSRATAFAYRPDPTRLVTALGISKNDRCTLALVDLETDETRHIDDHVFIHRSALLPGEDRELLAYSVMDGARSGVWLARLPPAQ